MMSLNEKSATLMRRAVSNEGYNPDDFLYQIEEELTPEEYETVEAFGKWVFDNNKTFGWNIMEVFEEFRKAQGEQPEEVTESSGTVFAALHVDQQRSAETKAETFTPKLFDTYSLAVDAIWKPIARAIAEDMPDHFLDSYLDISLESVGELSDAAKAKLDAYETDEEKIEIIEWYVTQNSDEDFLSFYFIKELPIAENSK